jgi:hypothetical protein
MKSIRIIATPPGQAPLEIREKWIGTIIPLADQEVKGTQLGVKGGEAQNLGGHHVDTDVAIASLEKVSPEAADWWKQNVALREIPQLVFAREVCEVIEPLLQTFLYRLTAARNGRKDNVFVVGGTHYWRDQLLLVIDAVDVHHAAQALNVTIVGSFDRSSVNCPTVYYTSKSDSGSFHLSLKELEPMDQGTHPDLEEKIRFKIIVPQ